MEKILDKIEGLIEKQFTSFETSPIKTSIKFLIFYWIAKTIYKEIKEDIAISKKA